MQFVGTLPRQFVAICRRFDGLGSFVSLVKLITFVAAVVSMSGSLQTHLQYD